MVFAAIWTGVGKVTCCHPEPLSPVNVAVASSVPELDQSEPVWVPVFPAPL